MIYFPSPSFHGSAASQVVHCEGPTAGIDLSFGPGHSVRLPGIQAIVKPG